jgi:DNA-binding NtrC family response regulator
MTALLLVGTDNALIEGIAQILTADDYKLYFAPSLADALDAVGDARPLVVLVERSAVDEIRMTLRIPLAQRGAFIVFHGENTTSAVLPGGVQRATLAELELPLERQRLLALIRYVENRAQTTSSDRDSVDDRVAMQAI